MGINENMYPSKKEELAEYEPFKSGNVNLVFQGCYREIQIERIVLEVVNFEMVNGCFHAKLKDLFGDEIYGTFHANCKETIKTNRCRKGSVLVLKQVSSPLQPTYSLGLECASSFAGVTFLCSLGVRILHHEQPLLPCDDKSLHRAHLLMATAQVLTN